MLVHTYYIINYQMTNKPLVHRHRHIDSHIHTLNLSSLTLSLEMVDLFTKHKVLFVSMSVCLLATLSAQLHNISTICNQSSDLASKHIKNRQKQKGELNVQQERQTRFPTIQHFVYERKKKKLEFDREKLFGSPRTIIRLSVNNPDITNPSLTLKSQLMNCKQNQTFSPPPLLNILQC